MSRPDKRRPDEIRPVEFTPNFVPYAEGSVLLSTGNTRVLCNVSVEDGVPPWMTARNVTGGWVTGEYSMLPRATHTRSNRETRGLRGRSQEIQRLIGRALRASVDLELLGPRTFIVDCDVIQADGGTRTAAITGGFLALAISLKELIAEGAIPESVVVSPIAAISAGMVNGAAVLDLCYEEDVAAEVDANFVMNEKGEIIEVQGAAEGSPFSKAHFDEMFDLAMKGISQLVDLQRIALESISS